MEKKSPFQWFKFLVQILGYLVAFLGGSAVSGCSLIPIFNF